MCGGITTAVKISHTRAKHVNYNVPEWLQLLGSRFSCLFFFRLLKIERNETVARKHVRFKSERSPESFQ